jgi:GTP1/Obg family GTP-binding protein
VHRQMTAMIKHMAVSQQEMAKILEAERHVAVRLAQLVQDIPSFEGIEALTEASLTVTKNIAAYLNSLADFEDALADNLVVVLKEVQIPESQE